MAATTIAPDSDPEPTLTEILSDPIVEAMVEADRVDRHALQAMLREVARTRRLQPVA
jgi:hypothetical protein